jgi:hypothetical protein
MYPFNLKLRHLLLVALLLQIGCAGYRLGSSLPPGIDVVHVPVFLNQTDEPLLEVITTRAAVAEFQRDGTLIVGQEGQSDVTLSVQLTDFSMDPLRYERDTDTSVEEYRMTITASLQLQETRSGNILAQSVVIGEADFILSGDISSAKRANLPEAAEDLAARIVRASIEFW